MVGSILLVSEIEVLARELHTLEHTITLRNKLAPVFASRIGDISHHHTTAVGTKGSEKIYLAVNDIYDRSFVVLVGSHSDPSSIAAHLECVANTLTAYGDEHHRILAGNLCAMEMKGIGRVREHQCVVALRSADLMIIYLMVLIGVRELLALFGTRIRAIVETVAIPLCSGELRPLNMVGKKLLGGSIHHIYLGPVTTAAAYGIGCVLAILRLGKTCESHGAVVTERVGVKELFAL